MRLPWLFALAACEQASSAPNPQPAPQIAPRPHELVATLEDVAPDGTASLIRGLEAPVRLPDAGKTFKVTLPAIVHQFAAGHSIRLVVAGGSNNYRGGLTATPVTIASGTGQTLVLPVVS